MVLVLYNPVCGDGSTQSFFETRVLPLLQNHGNIAIDNVVRTERPKHAGTVVVDFINNVQPVRAATVLTIVLGSGDGTLQEIIDAVCSLSGPQPEIRFVLVPCGTANALYVSLFPASHQDELTDDAYKLKALNAFITGSKTVPLYTAVVTLSPAPSSPRPPTIVFSVVVVSTSLHAAILHDSESLRTKFPGLERFKVAAQMNVSRWYNSSVKLFPAPSVGVVQVYDPRTRTFVPYDRSTKNTVIKLDGPFIYFLSTGMAPSIHLPTESQN